MHISPVFTWALLNSVVQYLTFFFAVEPISFTEHEPISFIRNVQTDIITFYTKNEVIMCNNVRMTDIQVLFNI